MDGRNSVDDAHTSSDAMRPKGEHLLDLVQASPAALVAIRRLPDGRCCVPFMSSGAVQLFGFSVEQLCDDAEPLLARIHPEDRVHFDASNAESARSNSEWQCEFRYHHETAQERWIVGTCRPLRGPSDEITWSGVFVDITARKHIEDSLAVAESHLRSAFEAAEMGAWVFDSERGKMWGNRNQRELWQTPVGAPEWFDVSISNAQIHPEDRARAEGDLAAAMLGRPIRNEFRIVRADGAVRWIATRARGEVDSCGRPKRVTGINIDITQQKLSAEHALRSRKLEALGTLAGGIAHDINNVLFAILGNAEVALASIPQGGDTRPMLVEIEAAARRASDLVRQILTFSRPQDQQAHVLDMAGPVRDALKLVRATTTRMIRIESELDEHTPPIRADASRLVQVVLNLCGNAVHAIGKSQAGSVVVTLTAAHVHDAEAARTAQVPEGTYALLSIRDDGCGMDEATLARIYDPFFTTRPQGEGTGLGLSVVHGIMKALGAHITVTSQIGVGTCFRLYFPAEDAPTCAPHAAVDAPPRGRGQRILFVDDEPMVVRMATQLLQHLGYTPEAYLEPERAVTAFALEPQAYALAMTDLSMPKASGFDVTRTLLSIRSDLPLVLMSGNMGPEERAIATGLGIRETLLKPLDMSALGALLARLLGE